MRAPSRVISSLLSVLIFVSDGVLAHAAEANFWESRRPVRQLAAVPTGAGPGFLARPGRISALVPSPLSEVQAANPRLKAAFAALPRTAGTVRKILIPERPDGRVVVYVQDVHGNAEAQNHIAEALAQTTRTLPFGLLALEGAAGPLAVKAFQDFPAGPTKAAVGERLVREHRMSGAALAAWNAPAAAVGVDDASLHRANVRAYLSARRSRDALRVRWSAESARLSARKAETFNPSLAAFDAAVEDHRAGRTTISDYAAEIERRAPRTGGEAGQFLVASRLERSIDFRRVETERERLLKALVARLTDERSKDLLDLGLAYRSGAIGPAEFHAALIRLCAAAGVALSAYPEMTRYLAYVRASDAIDVERLGDELGRGEAAIYDSLARTTAEKRLARESRAHFLLGKLLDFSLSREEWADYLRQRGALSGWDVAPFEDFYRAADRRDAAIARNLLREIEASGAMTAALVTGGFHSAGVEKRLMEAGISILRFTPRVTKIDEGATVAALSMFAQEKTPLERIFEGRALFLSQHPFPLQTQRVAALRLSAGAVLDEEAEPADMISWMSRALPWRSVTGTAAEGRWNVAGVERRPDGSERSFAVAVDRSGDISFRRNLLENAVAWPLIETAALLAARLVLLYFFPGSETILPVVIGLAFAAVHPSVHQGPRGFSLSRFLVLALAGALFTGAMTDAAGVGAAFSMHAAYNASVVTARDIVENEGKALAGRAVALIANLPLAAVRGNAARKTRQFRVGRTNSVDKIVKATVLKIDGTPAPRAARVYPVLEPDQVEAEVRKLDARKDEIAATLDYEDPIAVETYEKMFIWFLGPQTRAITDEIRNNRKPAAQAVREVAEKMLKAARDAGKAGEEEWAQAGIAFADALDVRELSPEEVAQELLKVDATVDEMRDSLDYDDAVAIETYEKISMWFLSATKAEILADISANRKPAAQAVRDAAQKMLEAAQAAGKQGHEEWALAGLKFADMIDSGEQEIPADPLDDVTSPVVLVVRNPDLHQMIAFIGDPLNRVAAVVLEGRYEAKHWSAFMAQVRGIPVLGDLRGETTESVYDVVEDGDVVLVDAINYRVTTNPSRTRTGNFERQIEEQTATVEVLATWGGRPSVTRDGVPIKISAVSVDFPTSQKEIDAINSDAGGNVGLFRTEFLFASETPGNLDQKFEKMARNLDGTIRVRAIDRRPGDKNTVFDGLPGADKAELTWLLETATGEKALRDLMRALLTAQARLPEGKKNLEFFVPMMERPEQARRALEILAEVKAEVRAELSLPEDQPLDLRFGVMIETPLEQEALDGIIGLDGVDFVSIGTRDMAAATKVVDVIHRDYIDPIRRILTTAAKYGKEVGLCGEHTSNESLFLLVNSIPVAGGVVPSWAVVQRNIPRMKALVRATNHAALQASIKGGVNKAKIDRFLRGSREAVDREIHASADFEETFNRVLVREGVAEAVERDFSETTDRRLRAVRADAPRGKVSRDKATFTANDFSLINALGRHAVSSLQFVGDNGNRVLVYLARLAQSWIDRVVFSKDSRDRWTIIGAEGHRPGKDTQGTLPVGARLGFGEQPREMLLLSMETPQGLYTPNGGGTVLGRVYGDEGTLRPMPDAYMFKIVAARRLSSLRLTDIIRRAQQEGRDGIDMVRAALETVTRAEAELGRKPRVAVLLRDRQRGLIEALAGRLGIPDSYATIQARVEASRDGHVSFESPDGAVLSVYGYDDWSAGLSFGRESGLDLIIGTGGTPEATMSAVIAKKFAATFAGALLPLDNSRFTVQEQANLRRGGIGDTKRIYDEDVLVPGATDDVAVGIAVLRDFAVGGNQENVVAGPAVRDDGHVTANVLWVGTDQLMPVGLTYSTSLTVALRKAKQNPKSDEAAFNVALGWAEFGAYDRAAAVIKNKSGKKWKALDLFVQAGLALTRDDADAAVGNALAKYEEAMPLLDDPELNELRSQLAVRQRVRRLYYWLRDRAFRERRVAFGERREELFNAAVAAAARAFSYSTRGFETRRRENNVRLDGVVDRYDQLEAAQWTATGAAPDLATRIGTAYDVWLGAKNEPSAVAYAADLGERGAGIWNAVLFATVLRDEPLDEQARILRFLHRSDEAKKLAAEFTGAATLPRFQFIARMADLIETGRRARSWQSRALRSIPGERRVVRPEVREFLPSMESRPEASALLTELILASMAKAEIMPILGNAERRRPYLQEAAQYAGVIEAHPRLFGDEPLPVIFELAILYRDLAAASDDASLKVKATSYASLTREGDLFVSFLQGMKDGERRLYTDEQIQAWNEQRAALQAEHEAALGDRAPANDETPPTVNSLPYYLALLWNRAVGASAWRISSPEKWIAPGYAAEIALGVALVTATPVSATGVLAAVVVYAALHVIAWAAVASMDGRAGVRQALTRFALHVVGFLPYVLLAQAVEASGGLSLGVVLASVAVAVAHVAFDELLAGRTALTPAQEELYRQVLDALHAREAGDGLNRRIDTILPAAGSDLPRRAFARAMAGAARRSVTAARRTMGEVIDAALRLSSAGPILVFVTADGRAGDELTREALEKSRRRGGERRPVLVSIDPDVPDATAVASRIAAVQQRYADVPSAVRRLGSDVNRRDGAYHYEDLLAAFAADPRMPAPTRAMLSGLAAGRAEAGVRIVQVGASAQPFVGNPDLLALILLVVPLRTTSVLIDLQAVLLAARQA